MEQSVKILFEKFLNGSCTHSELDYLMEALAKDDHEADFREMLEKVYNDIDSSIISHTYAATSGSEAFERNDLVSTDPKSHFGHRRMLQIVAAVAACLLLLLGVGYFWKAEVQKEIKSPVALLDSRGRYLLDSSFKNQQTGRAEQKYLLLKDGTQVWLNAESSLIVPDHFEKNKRVVYLKGEAYFDVKHADKIPFIIHMPNNVSTTVLGTAFDIRAYDDRTFSVTVKRGKVQVSKDRQQLATLTVGQQIKVVDDTRQPVVKTVKQENIASWTEGKLVYDALEMGDILKDLERVYNVQIELKNSKLYGEVITTSFNRGDNVGGVIRTLCLLTGATVHVNGTVYIIE